ncbi:daptomycin-sensing surface protein LiaX [Alkalibacterium iburiense]|uniref:Daptomycin-sensing surface protein LiaX n=1 Tax=Alkalibacterium iburiense TaxID=290589 RepID=A0ABN0XB78_9LACT
MNERERIIELMKKGILSTEEGLDLLEHSAKKQDQKENQDFHTETVSTESVEEEHTDTFEEEPTEKEATEEQKEAEKTLEKLVEEINRYSVELDETNDKISKVKEKLHEKQDRLNQINQEEKKGIQEEKTALLEEIKSIQKELELIKQLDEVDNTDEIVQLREAIDQTSRRLEEIENREETAEYKEEETELKEAIEELEEELRVLHAQKQLQLKNLNRTKMKQWTVKAKQATSNFRIPEEWKKEAGEEFSKAGEKLETASKEWSEAVKKTVQQASESEVTQSVRSTIESALENFDWKNINVKLPTLATKDFNREWTFEESTATILDIKLANGKLVVKPSEDDTIRLSAKGKLYGRMDESTPAESFDARSTISVDDDKLVVHIPNKRIYADVELYLPKRTYDYVSINMLNGKLKTKDLTVKDIYAKSTNGEINFENLEATMLEAKGSNGTISISNGDLKDLLASSVNGSIVYQGSVESADLSTTNGEVKVTLTNENLIRLTGTTVNGNVKLAIPKGVAMEGKAKTTFGKVKSRLSDVEPIEKSGHTVRIKRLTGERPFDFTATTTTGNVLLKDTDK